MDAHKKSELVAGQIQNSVFLTDSAAQSGKQVKDFSQISLLSSQKFIMPKTIVPGMFLYEDGLIYPEVISGNRITSVVGFVKKSKGIAVCLHSRKLPWSSDLLNVEIDDSVSGREATRYIIAEALRQNKKAEAVQWCHEYAENGIPAGSAFLGALQELKLIQRNLYRVNEAFGLLKKRKMRSWCWSSIPHQSQGAWMYYFDDACRRLNNRSWDSAWNSLIKDGFYRWNRKTLNLLVWPMLAFEL